MMHHGGTWRSISVQVEGIDAIQSRRLADALARGERPCGCFGARLGLAIGTVCSVTLLLGVNPMSGRWVFAALFVLLASAIGHRVDIALARDIRRKAKRELRAHFSSTGALSG